MRRLFLELYHKQIFPSTPITSFSLFLSYIVVTTLMLGFEKEFSCHSHLGPIRIPPLFPFPSAPFSWFSHVTAFLPIRSIRNGSAKHPLGSLVLTLLYGIHSRSALGITSTSGWNSSQNPTTSPTILPQPFPVPLLKHNDFMFFHRLVIPLRSYLFFQFRSQLVHKIECPILLRTLDSIVFQKC